MYGDMNVRGYRMYGDMKCMWIWNVQGLVMYVDMKCTGISNVGDI